MTNGCIVPKCKNNSSGKKRFRFHKIPQEGKPNFMKWLDAIGITYKTFKATPPWKYHVCSKHFTRDAYKNVDIGIPLRWPVLKETAVPTLCLRNNASEPVSENTTSCRPNALTTKQNVSRPIDLCSI